MTVAICIPTYNQAPYLAEAVRSACAQTYRTPDGAPPEIWISDDASSDHTPQVVDELRHEFPHLRTYRQERNLGMSGNPRWIVSRPQTDYIVKLDSDDRLHPEYVSSLIALLEQHPDAGYGHCAVSQINDSGEETRVRRLQRASGFVEAEAALRAAVSGYRVAANICIFRREAMEAVNFYREDMRFCDDWDLSVRLADAGWGNVYCADILASYRVWEDEAQVRPRRKLDEVRGCIRVFAQALEPAFTKRGWDTVPLVAQRQALALRHATVLDSAHFTSDERQELVRLLQELGDSPRLRRRVRLMQMGCGGLLRGQHAVGLALRDGAKAMVQTLRRVAPAAHKQP